MTFAIGHTGRAVILGETVIPWPPRDTVQRAAPKMGAGPPGGQDQGRGTLMDGVLAMAVMYDLPAPGQASR